MKNFHVTGTVVPEENYMVDITNKLIQIKVMIDRKEYFSINRGRQYGKTTTLERLDHFLKDEYLVIKISFEGFAMEEFENARAFSQEFLQTIQDDLRSSGYDDEIVNSWKNDEVASFKSLGRHITSVCRKSEKPIVLMIDEVDKASNHFVFLDFLGKLREKYLARRNNKDFTFHSVILVGVYDVRNIKLKMIQEGIYNPGEKETTSQNSPWNIASDFEVNMSFSIEEISKMLEEYETDNKIGMSIVEIASEIYEFTSGYPVLVSRICKHIDEKLDKNWTPEGVRRAVKLILKEKSMLFDSLIKNLNANERLMLLMRSMVIDKRKWSYNPDNELIELGMRYGYFKEVESKVSIDNKIFEIRLTNYFLSLKELEENLKRSQMMDNSGIVEKGILNMEKCMRKFSEYFHKFYSDKDQNFIEREGRLLFLMFLSPILNGNGFSYIEAQTPDGTQTDIIVNFLNQQYIVELKIWDGIKKHEKAYDQLLGYMAKFHQLNGYLLTFNFNQKKELKHEWIEIDDKVKILDVII